MVSSAIQVNRAPVLTLWAALVAERMGFDRSEALTIGRALAGLSARAKGVAIGVYEPSPTQIRERRGAPPEGGRYHVQLMGREIPVTRTPAGWRALDHDRPSSARSVERYLKTKFGDALPEVRRAMERLVTSRTPDELAREAFRLYENFRPTVAPGARGWGAKGELDLRKIEDLATQK